MIIVVVVVVVVGLSSSSVYVVFFTHFAHFYVVVTGLSFYCLSYCMFSWRSHSNTSQRTHLLPHNHTNCIQSGQLHLTMRMVAFFIRSTRFLRAFLYVALRDFFSFINAHPSTTTLASPMIWFYY